MMILSSAPHVQCSQERRYENGSDFINNERRENIVGTNLTLLGWNVNCMEEETFFLQTVELKKVSGKVPFNF
jgi:hypothetical protein